MKNTIDITAEVYTSPTDYEFRVQAKTHPDFPDMVLVSSQYFDEKTDKYLTEGALSFDKTTWEDLKKAVDIVFSHTS